MKTRKSDELNRMRPDWIKTLSQADPAELESAVKRFSDNYTIRRILPPETGLLMGTAREDGSGAGFNFGEITVSKCVVELNDRYRGYGCIVGADTRHAELTAIMDGMLQVPELSNEVMRSVIRPLEKKQAEKDLATAEKTADTRVEFFTMQRGE